MKKRDIHMCLSTFGEIQIFRRQVTNDATREDKTENFHIILLDFNNSKKKESYRLLKSISYNLCLK